MHPVWQLRTYMATVPKCLGKSRTVIVQVGTEFGVDSISGKPTDKVEYVQTEHMTLFDLCEANQKIRYRL